MKRRIQIWIEPIQDSGDYEQIELFNDEQVVVNSSVQNISDISKVFTDFSQSFSVPASTINNAIFQHFYQSDVDANVDHNVRRKAYIEIDLTPFIILNLFQCPTLSVLIDSSSMNCLHSP